MDINYISIAEAKHGFVRGTPYIQFGDSSPRWLKGGGWWEMYDVIAFVKYKEALGKLI